MQNGNLQFNNEQYVSYDQSGNAERAQIQLYKKCIEKIRSSIIREKGEQYYDICFKALDDNNLKDRYHKVIARFFMDSVKSDKTKKAVMHNTSITRNSLQIHPSSVYIANLIQREMALPKAGKEVHLLLGVIYDLIKSLDFSRSGSKADVEERVQTIISVIKEITHVLHELNRKGFDKIPEAIKEVSNILECMKKESIEMIMKAEQNFETLNYTSMAEKLDDINNKFKFKKINGKESKLCDFFRVIEIAYNDKLKKPDSENITQLRKKEYMLREKISQVREIFSINMNETITEHEIKLVTKYPEINKALKELDSYHKEFKKVASNSYSSEHLTEPEIECINHYLKIYDNLQNFQKYITGYNEFVKKCERKLIYKGILNSSDTKTNDFISRVYQKTINAFSNTLDDLDVLRSHLDDVTSSLSEEEKNYFIYNSRKSNIDINLEGDYFSLENAASAIKNKIAEIKIAKANLDEDENNPFSKMNGFLNKYSKENRPENQKSHNHSNTSIFHKNHEKVNDQIESIDDFIKNERKIYINNVKSYHEKLKSTISTNKVMVFLKKIFSSSFRKKYALFNELTNLFDKKSSSKEKVNHLHTISEKNNNNKLKNMNLNFKSRAKSHMDLLSSTLNDYFVEIKMKITEIKMKNEAVEKEKIRMLENAFGEMMRKANNEANILREQCEDLEEKLKKSEQKNELLEQKIKEGNVEKTIVRSQSDK